MLTKTITFWCDDDDCGDNIDFIDGETVAEAWTKARKLGWRRKRIKHGDGQTPTGTTTETLHYCPEHGR